MQLLIENILLLYIGNLQAILMLPNLNQNFAAKIRNRFVGDESASDSRQQ